MQPLHLTANTRIHKKVNKVKCIALISKICGNSYRGDTCDPEKSPAAADQIQSFLQVAIDRLCDEQRWFNLKACIDDSVASVYPKFSQTLHTIIVRCPDDLELLKLSRRILSDSHEPYS